MNNKMAINTLSTIALNVNKINAPIKRPVEAEWVTKQDPYTGHLQETHFRLKTHTD